MASRWYKPCHSAIMSLRNNSAQSSPRLTRILKPKNEGVSTHQRVAASSSVDKMLLGQRGGGKLAGIFGTLNVLSLCQDSPKIGPAQLIHYRFLSSAESNAESNVNVGDEKTSSTIFITTSCLEGSLMEESSCISLQDILANERSLCFENSTSSDGYQWPTPVLQEILRKILFIGFKKFEEDASFFIYDPAKILIMKTEGLVLEVGVSQEQLMDGATKCDYEDAVLGPFAHLLYRTLFSEIFRRTDGLYKEVCHMLHVSSQKQKYWKTLDDIFSMPVFWTVKEKYIAIICARTFLSDGSAAISHGLKNVTKRRFKFFNNGTFEADFPKFDFYMMDLQVDLSVKSAPLKPVRTRVSKNWQSVFGKAFISTYYFGPSKIRFCRVVLAHFFDENFTGYAVTLDKQSIKTAVIHLDCVFNLCLSVYCTLKNLQKSHPDLNIKDILDVVYRTRYVSLSFPTPSSFLQRHESTSAISVQVVILTFH